MIIKYETELTKTGIPMCKTFCPHGYCGEDYMNMLTHVNAATCQRCPHYHGPGPDPNTIECGYGDDKREGV
jgi:hypothetical protein